MISKKPLNVKIILNESYLQAVKNSIGSNLFRNLYAFIGNRRADILRDGTLSCAAYASSILYLFKLISDVHSTVEGTVKDLEKSGWQRTQKPRPGAVLVWERQGTSDNMYRGHAHIGFYAGNGKAISNSCKTRRPTLHHWTFGNKNGRPIRKIEQIFWHPKLN